MSVIREAGISFGAGPKAPRALRAGRRRWANRTSGVVLLIGVAAAGGALLPYIQHRALTVPVTRADLVISLAGYGVVESRDNVDINCEVPGSPGIRQIVPDGSFVRRGDVLVRLDSTVLEEAIAAQKQALAKAEAAVVQASKDLQAAQAAIASYREGTFLQQCLQYDRDILLAQKSLAAAEHSLLQSQIAHRRGFGARVHVEAREFVSHVCAFKLSAGRSCGRSRLASPTTSWLRLRPASAKASGYS